MADLTPQSTGETGDLDTHTLDGLAKSWESDRVVRYNTRKSKTLLTWPKKLNKDGNWETLTGVCSMEALKMNAPVMRHLLEYWCPIAPDRKTAHVDYVKPQARRESWTWISLALSSLNSNPIRYSTSFCHTLFPQQVREFREQLGLDDNVSLVYCEAHGMKGLVSLMIRRHDGSKRRDSQLD